MPYKNGKKWKAQVRREGQRMEKTFNTRKEAIDWEAGMRKKPAEEWIEKTDMVSLTDWAERYLDFAKVKFSGKTYKEKSAMFRQFLKEVNPDIEVTGLKPGKVLAYVTKQKTLRSGYAANKDRKNLVAAWNWGMKYMDPPLPGPNPCLVERMPEVRQPRYVPPEEDFWKVYDVAEGQDKLLLITLLHLAARRSEIFRLKWEDVDFISRRIRLKTQKRRDGTLECDWLPMTEELRKTLRWWWENRPIKNHDYVFICVEKSISSQEHYGQPFKQRRHLMNRLCDKAKVKRFGFHAIRHLTATILYHAGYDLGVIQAILRHKHATTTNQYLRSLGLENLRAAMEEGLPLPKARVIELPITKQKKLENAV